MDVETLLMVVIVLFTLAALGGLSMAAVRFGANCNPPAWLAMGHGVLAAAGLTLLVFAAFTSTLPALAKIAAVLLVGAAIGGAFMNLAFHWQHKLLPKSMVAGHALLAVTGYVLLLMAIRG